MTKKSVCVLMKGQIEKATILKRNIDNTYMRTRPELEHRKLQVLIMFRQTN